MYEMNLWSRDITNRDEEGYKTVIKTECKEKISFIKLSGGNDNSLL